MVVGPVEELLLSKLLAALRVAEAELSVGLEELALHYSLSCMFYFVN